MHAIGRNEPCYCGSGKKYKHCCLTSDTGRRQEELPPTMMENMGQPNGATQMIKDLREEIGDRVFESEAEMQAFVKDFHLRKQNESIDDFLGLSSNQMHSLLYDSFEDLSIVKFNDEIRPLLLVGSDWYFMSKYILTNAIIPGIKMVKQNKSFCTEFVVKIHNSLVLPIEPHSPIPQSEKDMPDLIILRYFLMETKMLRKVKDHYIISKKGMTFLREDNVGLYRELFTFFSSTVEWISVTNLPDTLSFIQDTHRFLWYVLHKKGKKVIRSESLIKAFKRAFPEYVNGFIQEKEGMSMEQLNNAIPFLFLIRYASHMGWVHFKNIATNSNDLKFVTTPLFRKVLMWNV